MNKKTFFSIIVFIIGELIILAKLFTKTSFSISLISLFSILLILNYVVPNLINLFNKNNILKKVVSSDITYWVVLIIFVFSYYQFLDLNNNYSFYVALHFLLIIYTTLYQIKLLSGK